MPTFTLELPSEIKVQVGKTKHFTVVPIGQMSLEVLQIATVNGFMGKLNDISMPKDDNGKPLGEDAWTAMRDKRVKVWLGGTWAATERGDSSMTMMKAQYITEQVAKGRTVNDVEKTIKSYVKDAFGPKESATFGRFLDAIAVAKHPKDADAQAEFRTQIENDLWERTQEARRTATETKLDLSDIGF